MSEYTLNEGQNPYHGVILRLDQIIARPPYAEDAAKVAFDARHHLSGAGTEVARLREACAQERAARERAEAEGRKWKEVAWEERERANRAEAMLAQARQQ